MGARTDDCPGLDQLDAHRRGDGEEAQRDALERHLAACERCRVLAEELGRNEVFLRELQRLVDDDPQPPSPPPEPRASLVHRLRETFGEEAGEGVAIEGESHPDPDLSRELLSRLANREGFSSRFRIKEEVSHGGMGVVLRVWDADLMRHLAMKVLKKQPPRTGPEASQAAARELSRFLEEARVTGQLDHPGIVPVHELGITEGDEVYFTMNLVKGRNLAEVIDLVQAGDEGWTLTRGVGVVQRVCEAMAYAHDRGVLHRDLKPANIMVGRFGEVIVLDWGLARIQDQPERRDVRIRRDPMETIAGLRETRLERGDAESGSPLLTMDGEVLGTPAYMSPEQAAGDVDLLTPRSDVYSIGAVLYHLLTGYSPYAVPGSRLSAWAVLYKLEEGPPVPVHQLAPQVPAELVAVCERAMGRDPERRYRSASELGWDLQAYIEDRVVRAYRTGALTELRMWVRRNRGLAAGIAIALLGVVAGLGATVAVEAARRAELRLEADVAEAPYLVRRAEALWPVLPETVPAMDAWLRQARALVGRRATHEERHGAAAARADGPAAEARAGLLADLDLIAAPDTGWLARIEARRALASVLLERTVTGDAARAAWERVTEEIAASERYGLFDLSPQLGLLPLGADLDSGLQEFALLASGAVPVRGDDGALELTPETGVVLVLLPEGEYEMGAQTEDHTLESFDPDARADEYPPHWVQVDPLFVSKYELTQEQWERLSGARPSAWRPDSVPDHVGALHPVENMSWEECVALLPRLELRLPTEEEWEYACRAGTVEPYTFGAPGVRAAEFAGLAVAHENFADDAAARVWAPADPSPWDDGFAYHAPVGSFVPNGFGLHDVHGNVVEWCSDVHAFYEGGPAPQAEVVERDLGAFRATRGGSFAEGHIDGRSSRRNWYELREHLGRIGVRPVRDVQP